MLNTILFDMGGTLEDIYFSPETITRATARVSEILKKHGLNPGCDETALWEILSAGIKRYKEWSEGYSREKKPEEIWPDYYLSELPLDKTKLAEISEEISGMWEVNYFQRDLRPDVPQTLEALRQRGYRMDIVSNNCSLYSVFDVLGQYGIREYFEDVTVSCIVGYRKPSPMIFNIALRQMRVQPENCVYVGDTRSRDIIGAKRAGFARAVLIESKLTARNDSLMKSDTFDPDYIVETFSELLPYLDGQA